MADKLDSYLASHLIDPALQRGDQFDAFMGDRQKRPLGLIEQVMGKVAYTGDVPVEVRTQTPTKSRRRKRRSYRGCQYRIEYRDQR